MHEILKMQLQNNSANGQDRRVDNNLDYQTDKVENFHFPISDLQEWRRFDDELMNESERRKVVSLINFND